MLGVLARCRGSRQRLRFAPDDRSASQGDVAKDQRDIVRDQRDIKTDRKDIARDRADIRTDQRDINTDHKDIARDRTDIRADQQDIHKDRQDLRTDRGDLRNNPCNLRTGEPSDPRNDRQESQDQRFSRNNVGQPAGGQRMDGTKPGMTATTVANNAAENNKKTQNTQNLQKAWWHFW